MVATGIIYVLIIVVSFKVSLRLFTHGVYIGILI